MMQPAPSQLDLPRLRPGDAERARTLAARIANELATPPTFGSLDRAPSATRWHHQSLSKGAPGIALLHALHAHSDHRSEVVHRWLRHATGSDGLSVGPGAGLWFGAPALAFAIAMTSPERYPDALATLDAAVTTLTETRLAAARTRIRDARRPRLAEFDVVRGMSGLGAYLLRRDPAAPLLREVLAYLVTLTRPLRAARDAAGPGAPGWWSSDPPPGRSTDSGGHANLGMAHGIAGPLVLLALAVRAGVTVPGQAEAIDQIIDWLDAWRQNTSAAPWWPEQLTVADLRAGRPAQAKPGRPSWCYGLPGLARAQQLAAIARRDRIRQVIAEDILTACLRDATHLARLTDLTLCHGWAGMTLTAWMAAADSATTSGLAALLPDLTHAFLNHAFRDPAADSAHPASDTSPPGLIDGRAGIALVAHTFAESASDQLPAWPSCLLLI